MPNNSYPKGFVKNPRIKLYYDKHPLTNDISGLTALAPNRRLGRQCVRAPIVCEEYKLIENFCAGESDSNDIEYTNKNIHFLIDTSLLIPEQDVSKLAQLRCVLDLDTPPSTSATVNTREDYELNPKLYFGDNPKAFVHNSFFQTLSDNEGLVYVPYQETGVATPYIVANESLLLARALFHHEIDVTMLNAKTIALFVNAGILVNKHDMERVRNERALRINQARDSYARQQYAVYENILPEYLLKQLQDYYRSLCTEGYATTDNHVAKRGQIYAEEIAVYLQQQLSPFVSEVCGETMRASTCLFFQYRNGASLKRHIDKDIFSIVLSLAIEYSPFKESSHIAPFYLSSSKHADDESLILLRPGSGVIFNGKKIYHSRKPYKGYWFNNLVFGYVNSRYKGRLGLY